MIFRDCEESADRLRPDENRAAAITASAAQEEMGNAVWIVDGNAVFTVSNDTSI